MKQLYIFISAMLLFASCSNERVDDFFKRIIQAPPSSIERDVKGHDQIYAVHAILRMGYRGGLVGVGPNGDDSVRAYNTYHVTGDSTLVPILQEIDIARDDDGQMVITTARKQFDVVASDKIYYGLELRYYDQNGLLINHQFSGYPYKKDKDGVNIPDEDNATLLVHQHFFTVGNASLDQRQEDDKEIVRGIQLAYPRTLEQPSTYYDRYTFRGEGAQAVFSPLNSLFLFDAA